MEGCGDESLAISIQRFKVVTLAAQVLALAVICNKARLNAKEKVRRSPTSQHRNTAPVHMITTPLRITRPPRISGATRTSRPLSFME